MPQLNLVVELTMIGVMGSATPLLAALGIWPGSAPSLWDGLNHDLAGARLLAVVVWCYLLGILVNGAAFRILKIKKWPVTAWYSRFREEHFNNPYFKAIGEDTQRIDDDTLVAATYVYVASRNQTLAQGADLLASYVRIVRSAALLFAADAVICGGIATGSSHNRALWLIAAGTATLFALACGQTFKGIETLYYRRLLQAFLTLRGNDQPHSIVES